MTKRSKTDRLETIIKLLNKKGATVKQREDILKTAMVMNAVDAVCPQCMEKVSKNAVKRITG